MVAGHPYATKGVFPMRILTTASGHNSHISRVDPPDRRWQVFAVTSLAAFMVFLDSTIVNVAFPALRRSFPATSQAELSWVLNAYSTVFAALLLASGRLADLIGRRRVFFAGMLVFSFGSALCGLAPTASLLIAARVLQAAGGALLVPASLSLLLPAFPPAMRAAVVGLYGSVASVAAACGPSLGALLIDKADWRWAFFLNVPIGLVAWLGGRQLLVESRDPHASGRPDLLGVGALILSLGALALAIVQGNTWGWSDARTIGAFAIAALGVPFCIWRSAVHPSPVIHLGLFRSRVFSTANIASLLFGSAFFAALLGNILFLTGAWHYSILKAGFAVTPGPIFAAFVAGPAGRLAGRYGHRLVLVPGALIFAGAMAFLLARVGATPAYLETWLPASIAFGIGAGMTLPTLTSAAASALPPADYGLGSAMINTTRQFGAVLGVAILIAILGTPAQGAMVSAFDRAWTFCLAMALASAGACLALGRTVVPAAVSQGVATRQEAGDVTSTESRLESA
jgi:EmrB/QacA subfamily drug resistance transporter